MAELRLNRSNFDLECAENRDLDQIHQFEGNDQEGRPNCLGGANPLTAIGFAKLAHAIKLRKLSSQTTACGDYLVDLDTRVTAGAAVAFEQTERALVAVTLLKFKDWSRSLMILCDFP